MPQPPTQLKKQESWLLVYVLHHSKLAELPYFHSIIFTNIVELAPSVYEVVIISLWALLSFLYVLFQLLSAEFLNPQLCIRHFSFARFGVRRGNVWGSVGLRKLGTKRQENRKDFMAKKLQEICPYAGQSAGRGAHSQNKRIL